MARGTVVLRLGDTTVRIWRPVTVQDRFGTERSEYVPVGTALAKVNRATAPLADVGPGLSAQGRRRLYFQPEVDVRIRDVLELIAGPDAPQRLEADEPPTRPRDHHCQVDCLLWRGELPAVEGES